MKELNKKIEALHLEVIRKDKIIIHLKHVKKRLADREKELIALEKALDKEQYAVEELEKLSMRGLFFKVLGNKEEQMELARQQYLVAFMQYHDCLKRIDAKKYEIKLLEEKLSSLSKVEGQLEGLIKKKRMQLKFKDKKLAERLIKQEEKLRIQKGKLKELKEAIVFGKKPLALLEKIYEAMKTMKYWNIFANRGIGEQPLSFYDQKQFVKKKLNDLVKLNKLLDEFSEELHDVGTHYKLDYKGFIDHLQDFMKRFYDGLISDWIFHKKITVSINITLETIDKLKRLLSILDQEVDKTKSRVKEERDLLSNMVIFLNP